jgi:hypothetical protein
MAFFLSIYPTQGLEVPIGWDNVDYVWRTRLAQVVGIGDIPSAVPPGTFVKSGRPAFLVVAATTSSVTGLSLLFIAVVIPAVMAATMGLAAGALGRMGAGLRGWEGAAVAVIAGLSLNAVLMIQYGYVDNLMMACVFLLAAVATLASMEDRRAVIPAVLCLGAAGLTHGSLFSMVLVTMGAFGLAYLPTSWRGWRSGREGLLDTPAGRVGLVLGGGGLVAGAAIYGLLSELPSPRLSRGELTKKLREDLPRYRFGLILPAAAVGLGGLAWRARRRPPRSRPRRLLTLLLVWVAVTACAYLLYRLTTLPIPANRLLLFAFAVPILIGLAAVWAGRAAGRASRWLHAGVLVAAVVGVTAVSAHEWRATKSWIDAAKLKDVAIAETYLSVAGVPSDRPVIFLVDDRGPLPAATIPFMRDHVYAVLTADRVANTYLYVGSPDEYLARRPTRLPGRGQYNVISLRFFRLMDETFDQRPVALISSSYNQAYFDDWVAGRPESRIPGTDLAVVQGPPPPEAMPPTVAPVGPPSALNLGLAAVAILAMLGLIGLGWSLALLGRWLDRTDVVALAPAAGLAALVLAGTVADRVGVHLAGLPGTLVPVLAGAAGWFLLWAIRRREATRPVDAL